MKAKKVLTALSVGICALFFVCACNNEVNVNWELHNVGMDVDCHTTSQADYLNGDYTKIGVYATGSEELSRPKPVNFSWTAASNAAAESYVVELSQSYDFVDSIGYETADTNINIYNLFTGTMYFWRVTAKFGGGAQSVSSVAAFTTADAAPRNLYVDGITNVRDLGGWKTETGGSVKQGMIYRCGRLNESERTDVKIEITEKGIREMKEVLGVRTEVDLRMTENDETGGITSSPLGEGVNYVNIPMDWIMDSNFNYLSDEKFYPAIRQFFTLLADESNYPIAFHCNIGTDRTGLFAFLINGLVGVAEEDLYRDYLFSNFGQINGSRSLNNIKSYVDTIKQCDGETLSKKTENCLIGIGVKKSEIDAVREIMTA